MDDLREAKQFEHTCKTLQIVNSGLEQENARLQEEINVKIEREVAEELNSDERNVVAQTLSDQVTELKTEL